MLLDERLALQVGNSVGMTFPPAFLKAAGINVGDKLEVGIQRDVIYVAVKNATGPKLTPEFKEWLDDFSTRYESTIKELANLP